jgi:multimeric flavodoxin WrbA
MFVKRSPDPAHTGGLVETSANVMRKHGAEVEVLRAVDPDIATGVSVDMTAHGWSHDDWPPPPPTGDGQPDPGPRRSHLNTGNKHGIKHCEMNVLHWLQHLGCTIPPQADAGWIGEAGPGLSYLDEGSGGPQNDFTNRNTAFMTWNLMHAARMLQHAGGIPAHGNQRSDGTPAPASTTRTPSTADRAGT